jgi:hypothetical protein
MLLFSFLEVRTVENRVHCHFGHPLATGTLIHSALPRADMLAVYCIQGTEE